MARFLVGDIGGTNTRLALWDGRELRHVRTWRSGEHAGVEGPIAAWIADHGAFDAACLGVAGPVRDGRCVTTNLPWVVDSRALTATLGCPVRVVNDFVAAARGTERLGPEHRHVVRPGTVEPGAPVAVLGAGTGLGEAIVVGGEVVPGEGGHAEFGPTDERELRFTRWLWARHGRASWEMVLSGPGLVNLARFDYEDRGDPAPPWLDGPDAAHRVRTERPQVVAWFCALYGAEAGNLALRVLARGGVWLCGGIAPSILDELRSGAFERRFLAKGKVADAIRDVPVTVADHPALGLLGAAAEAERALG